MEAEPYIHAGYMKMPEDWTCLGEYEMADEPYEFGLIALWRDAYGNLRAAYDEGCSCPTPFEGFTPADFREIRKPEDIEPLFSTYHKSRHVNDMRSLVRRLLREG